MDRKIWCVALLGCYGAQCFAKRKDSSTFIDVDERPIFLEVYLCEYYLF